MIEISLTSALALYSGILALLAAALWLYTEMAVHRPQRGLQKQFLWRCVFCGFTYLDETAERVSQCPRCNSYNSVRDKSAREAPVSRSMLEEHDARDTPADGRRARNTSRRKRPHQRHRGPRSRR